MKTVPKSDAERLDWIRLIRSRRVGPTTFQRLMRETGSAAAALDELPRIAQDAGLKDYQPCPLETAKAEYARASVLGAEMICYGASSYPAGLYDLNDPPPYLWGLGRVELLQCPSVAIVGARNASSVGKNMARRLARELGQAGNVIVSGLARGIDRAAHEAALEHGTIAVLAGGADINYPQECTTLADEVRERGLCISEMPFGVQPQSRHFPNRNRIISGISGGVIVVEGAAKSGSLITARNALDQGREVMAVPGSPLDARASGCNMLIRDGAQLVRNAADVLECLSPPTGKTAPAQPDPPTAPPPAAQTANPEALLKLLGPTPIGEDTVIEEMGLDPRQTMTLIAELEMAGSVERHPGGRISRSMPETV